MLYIVVILDHFFSLYSDLKGDMVEYRFDRGNVTIFKYGPTDLSALEGGAVAEAMACGLTPTFDRFVHTDFELEVRGLELEG